MYYNIPNILADIPTHHDKGATMSQTEENMSFHSCGMGQNPIRWLKWLKFFGYRHVRVDNE